MRLFGGKENTPMEKHNVRVTYFNLPARGECIRLMLVYGQQDFEDIRFDTDCLQDWRSKKHEFPFRQLPVYQENDRIAHQTVAILRYLGRKFGLIGSDDWENLQIDSIADTFTDFSLKIIDYHYEKSAKEKQKKKEPLFKHTIPFYLSKFEKISEENGGHLALNKLTWIDFYWAGFIEYLSWMIDVDIFSEYPNLKAVRDNVYQLPAVLKWYDEHPIPRELAKRWITKSGTPSQE